MLERSLGRTGRRVSVVGLGTWQLGADWGSVTERDGFAVLDASAAAGVTFFDTADVYGDGRSEQLIGRFMAARPELSITVGTKVGRRLEQLPGNYTPANFQSWVDRSRRNLGVDQLDLVQLHCPPSEVIDSDATYDAMDDLVDRGAVAAYGVSVETVGQAMSALARPRVASIQIVLNAFRLKPLDHVLPAAMAAEVGIIARVPLASGLLSGRYDLNTVFAPDDHRSYNRDGKAFDVGETFAGVDYETGVAAAQSFKGLVEHAAPALTPAQAAIAWAWQQPGVSTVIPGARNVSQAQANAAAGDAAILDDEFLNGVGQIYAQYLSESLQSRW